jgi:lipopolysaccharide exporter
MSEVELSPRRSSGSHMLHGSFWLISMRWAIRLTGVVSTLILVRLLSPADFGVVALAMVVVGMLEIFSQTGQEGAIVRMQNPTREHYDTAWTLSVLIGLAIGTAIFLAAPFTTYYFHDPRSVAVMRCLALRAVLGGFANIGMVDFKRNLRFDKYFQYNCLAKLCSASVAIVLAIVLRTYWALVGGMLTAAVALNVLSYIMSSYRPRFSLAKLHEIWSFSIWSLIRSIAFYLNGQIDLLTIAGFVGASQMGKYAVAHDTAASATDEINGPMTTVLFPVMARVQDDKRELRRLYLRVLGWSAAICASTSTGIAMISNDFVHVVLGQKWLGVIPLMPWLALSAGVLGLSSGAFGTFDVLNMPRRGARMMLLRLFMMAVAIVPVAYITNDLVDVAAARLVVTAIFMPTLFLAIGAAVGVRPSEQIEAVWRPMLAAGVMALAIWAANTTFPPYYMLLRMIFDVILGGAAYAGALLSLWVIAGRPESPERDALSLLRSRLGFAQ